MKLTKIINYILLFCEITSYSALCLIGSISLSGCAATAIGGATVYATDPRSSIQMSRDHDIKSAVKDALGNTFPKNNIEVTSYPTFRIKFLIFRFIY
jgi:hypothetical protein